MSSDFSDNATTIPVEAVSTWFGSFQEDMILLFEGYGYRFAHSGANDWSVMHKASGRIIAEHVTWRLACQISMAALEAE